MANQGLAQEHSGEHIARPLGNERELGCVHNPRTIPGHGQGEKSSGLCLISLNGRHDHDFAACLAELFRGVSHSRECRQRAFSQKFKFEVVRTENIGAGHGVSAEKLNERGFDVDLGWRSPITGSQQ